MPFKPRWLNALYAFVRGYFWLPCPVSGKEFGGHEWFSEIDNGHGGGVGICPECARPQMYLTNQLVQAISWRARAEGNSRSEIIREALQEGLKLYQESGWPRKAQQ